MTRRSLLRILLPHFEDIFWIFMELGNFITVFTWYRRLSLSSARLIQSSSSWVGRDSVVGIVTRYGLDNPGIDAGKGKSFCTRPDRWGPPSLLCNGYRVFPRGVKRPVRGVYHPPPSSVEVKERVELYLCSPSGPSWPVLRRTSSLVSFTQSFWPSNWTLFL